MPAARLGLIGAGFIGEVHLRALRHNARAEVRALADLDEVRLRQAQAAFQVPKVYTDTRAMLASEALDGVIIATPDHLHREPVELAAVPPRRCARRLTFTFLGCLGTPRRCTHALGAGNDAHVDGVVSGDVAFRRDDLNPRRHVALEYGRRE
jgi:hypothetical protein